MFAATLGAATIAPLDFALDPDAVGKPGIVPAGVQAAAVIARVEGPDHYSGHTIFVLTPELMRIFGVDNSDLGTQPFSATEAGEYVFLKASREEPEVVDVDLLPDPGYRDLPHAFVARGPCLAGMAICSHGMAPRRGATVDGGRAASRTPAHWGRQRTCGCDA